MGIELHFKDDLAAMLAGLERQTGRFGSNEYANGYQAALDDLRTLLSIPLPQRDEIEGQGRLLED